MGVGVRGSVFNIQDTALISHLGRLEGLDALARRVEEASRIVPLERLAISPQCGFATSVPGNLLSEEDQWRKLGLLVAVARKVWG